MARQNCQQRSGVRHSNPKPSPPKKQQRVPGEGRFRTPEDPEYWDRWFAWNHRRSVKVTQHGYSQDLIAEVYRGMPAWVYRHNLRTGGRSELEMLRGLARDPRQ